MGLVNDGEGNLYAEEVWESVINEDVQCCAECAQPLSAEDGEYAALVNEDGTIDFFHVAHAPRFLQIAHEMAMKKEAAKWN